MLRRGFVLELSARAECGTLTRRGGLWQRHLALEFNLWDRRTTLIRGGEVQAQACRAVIVNRAGRSVWQLAVVSGQIRRLAGRALLFMLFLSPRFCICMQARPARGSARGLRWAFARGLL